MLRTEKNLVKKIAPNRKKSREKDRPEQKKLYILITNIIIETKNHKGDKIMEEKTVSMIIRGVPEALRKDIKIRAAMKEMSMQDLIIDMLIKSMQDAR